MKKTTLFICVLSLILVSCHKNNTPVSSDNTNDKSSPYQNSIVYNTSDTLFIVDLQGNKQERYGFTKFIYDEIFWTLDHSIIVINGSDDRINHWEYTIEPNISLIYGIALNTSTNIDVNSDNTKYTYVHSSTDGKSEVWVYDAELIYRCKIAEGSYPRFLGDNRVAYLKNDQIRIFNHIYYDADSLLFTETGSVLSHLQCSPDKNSLIYIKTPNSTGGSGAPPSLMKINSDGTNSVSLFTFANGYHHPQSPMISPKGDKISFWQGSQQEEWSLWMINIDGTNPVEIKSNANTYTNCSSSWSADGKQIVYPSQNSLKIMTLDGLQEQKLEDLPDSLNIALVSWSK